MYQADINKSISFFNALLKTQCSKESLDWLEQKVVRLKNEFSEKEFYLTFSLLSRHFGKEKIEFSGEQLKVASEFRVGFNPSGFSLVQVARILLVLAIPTDDQTRFFKILNNLFATGEVNELVALYSSLPILPYPESLKSRASEGIRANMTVVFDAVALNNPYPSEFLDEDAFNQMVLKAIFIERPLDKIYGLDARANQKLARMLSDYAHERWAASRYVTPELWRPVGPFIDANLLKDIERLFEQGGELEKEAAVLAVSNSKNSFIVKLIPEELKIRFERKEFNWHTVSQKWFAEKNKS